jgi:hypothetical protein
MASIFGPVRAGAPGCPGRRDRAKGARGTAVVKPGQRAAVRWCRFNKRPKEVTMTTKSKSDPAAKLAELDGALRKAREEAAEVGVRLRAQQSRYRELEATLAALARSEPGEFNDDGSPRGDGAKKLQSELAKLQASRLGDLAAGARDRVHAAEMEITRHVGKHSEELSRAELLGPGKAATEKMRHGARLIAESYAEYVASTNRQIAFCAATQGLDGQDVFSDPRAAEAARAAGNLDDLTPPRSQSLTPLVTDEVPRRYRVRSGGFVVSPHADDTAGVKQPERVEA